MCSSEFVYISLIVDNRVRVALNKKPYPSPTHFSPTSM